MFAGYIVAILVLMALAVAVIQRTAVVNKDAKTEYYRQQAINVAMAGFEDGVSFFRRQPDGVYLAANVAYAPTSPMRVTAGAWPLWPDSAFNPGVNDTDYFSQILTPTTSGSTTVYVSASALIRTIALEDYATTSTSTDAKSSRLWGRYVLRRQNARNWDPYNNTSEANTDPEAVHDLTAILGYNTPGTGNYWSLFSRGYVFTNPTDITIAAAHTNNSLLNAPLRMYQGRPLLRASAAVYGEINRLNFDTPQAAVYVFQGSTLTVNALGIVQASNGMGMAEADGTNYTGSGTLTGSPARATVGAAPSISYVFPGQNLTTLQKLALSTGHIVYSNTDFPCTSSVSYTSQVSQTTFYYCNTTATTTFASGDCHVLSGVGLAFFRGDVIIQAKNYSSWAGIVYTMGNATVLGSGNISGLLIAQHSVTVGSPTGNDKAVVEYNNDAVNATQNYLQAFRVVAQSIVVTGN
jgi:hypothetical protein